MFERSIGLYRKFIGTGMTAGLLLVALIYLFITEKNKNNRVIFIYMPVLALALFFCPAFIAVIDRLVGTEIYFRFLWLVPTMLVIAYAAVKLVSSCPAKKRPAAMTACAAVIMLCGSLIYVNPEYQTAENLYHIPQYVVDVCDAIDDEDDIVIAAFPPEFLLYVRQYNVNIWMPYGRDHYRGIGRDELFEHIALSPVLDISRIANLSRARECHYVIVPRDRQIMGRWEDYGFELYGTVDGYLIYRDTQMAPGLDGYWLEWDL